MLKALAQELLTLGLLKHDSAVVVGVSGGPDSMALLHLLLELNQQHEWRLRVHIGHLNHQLRGAEADGDEAFVQAAADSLGVPCAIERRDIEQISRTRAGTIEELGRQERYAFLARLGLQVGAKAVAVAHHADDNAETILHRVLRGTGLRGLSGIPRSRAILPGSDIKLIRPLLSFPRQEILRYLSDIGIAYREDRSNASKEPMRNRIRQLLLPVIEAEVNPQVRDALLRLGEQAQWLEEFLQETVQRTFETLIVSRTDQMLVLNADALSRKSRIVQTELIRLAYRSFELGEQDLSFTNLLAALDLLGDRASGRQATLPGGMRVEKRYHQLVFSLPSDEARESVASEVTVALPGQTVLHLRQLAIETNVLEVTSADIPQLRRRGQRLDEHVDLEAVHPPLVVRARRSGERFCPLGAPGSKRLSDFLNENKVDPKERDRVALMCDQLGPIWVIGYRIDDRVKLTELTRRVLHLRARALGA